MAERTSKTKSATTRARRKTADPVPTIRVRCAYCRQVYYWSEDHTCPPRRERPRYDVDRERFRLQEEERKTEEMVATSLEIRDGVPLVERMRRMWLRASADEQFEFERWLSGMDDTYS